MNRSLPGAGPTASSAVVAALAALTSYLTLLAWSGFSAAPDRYLEPLFWVCAGVAALGLALRALGVPRALVPLVQTAGVGAALLHAWAPQAPLGGWVPTGQALTTARDVLATSVEASGKWAAPVPADVTELPPMLVLAGAAVALSVDLAATTLRRVPLAGLPLLAAFTAPVSILGGVPWPAFALAAGAFVLLLSAEQANRLSAWGRNLAAPDSALRAQAEPSPVRLARVWPDAARLGALGIGAAVLAPIVVPSGDGLLGGGAGGFGSGGGVDIDNPMADIKRDLTRGEDIALLRVRTDDPDPTYLRLTVLDAFDGETWFPSERQIPVDNRVSGDLPAAPGLASLRVTTTQHEAEFEASHAFDSTWLPAFYPSSEVSVSGDWRYDVRTLDVISAQEGLDTGGLTYEATWLEVQPDAADLVSAPPAPVALLADATELPDDLPDWVRELSREVTDGAASDFEEAVLLQRFFRVSGGFTYSTARGDGNGLEQLEQFLLGTGPEGRRGYCEQFATAMATMARAVGLPARVAVGFLRPAPVGAGLYEYSAHDLHAWPEIYFEGAGWVRFEPTPQSRADSVPAYTTAELPELEEPSVEPSEAPATQAPERPADRFDPGAAQGGDAAGDDGGLWAGLGWVGAALLLVGLALLPRALRGLARRRRLGGTTPAEVAEGAWQELRATALDLRLGWNDASTLRQRARGLAVALTREDDALRALEDLVGLLERARYARGGLAPQQRAVVESLVRSVTEAMHRCAAPAARRRARWLPVSVWAGLWRTRTSGSPRRGGVDERELDRLSV